mgnify:CR=1 FL=1
MIIVFILTVSLRLTIAITTSADCLVGENLIELFNLSAKVKILRHLLDSLSAHGSLDDVLCSHFDTWHRSITKRWVYHIWWNLRAWREDLPDFKRAFQLDDFDHFQWVLTILLGVFRENGRNLRACNIADFTIVQGSDITAAATHGRLLSADKWELARALDLRSAVGPGHVAPRGEALPDEWIHIDAQIHPALPRHKCVRYACARLIYYRGVYTVTERDSSPGL